MKSFLRSMIYFNKDSVYSEKEFQKLYDEISKYDRRKFNYKYSKAKSTFNSFEKITDLQSSVLLASLFGFVSSAYLEGRILNKFLALSLFIFLGIRAEIYFTLPRMSMKIDIYESVGRAKWKF